MRSEDIGKLYAYHCWATDRVLGTAAALTPEQFSATNALPWGSIRGTLAHMLDSEWLWRILLTEGSVPETRRDFAECATAVELRAAWEEVRAHWRANLAAWSDDDLQADSAYVLPNGAVRTQPLWLAVAHVVNHGTQHRAEVAQALTELGHSPGDLDLSYWHRIQQGIAT